MTIGKLKGLFNRLFKVDSSDQRLSSVDSKLGREVELDDDLRQLTFYSVQSGDTIYLRWWLKCQIKSTETTPTNQRTTFLGINQSPQTSSTHVERAGKLSKACWLLLSWPFIPLTNRVRVPYWKLRTEIFPHRFMAQARSARAINWRGKTRIPILQYGLRKRGYYDIYYISTVCLTGSGTIFIHAERLQISDASRKQNESIWNRC